MKAEIINFPKGLAKKRKEKGNKESIWSNSIEIWLEQQNDLAMTNNSFDRSLKSKFPEQQIKQQTLQATYRFSR